METIHKLVRFENRKLYSYKLHRYTNLNGLVHFINSGEIIEVVKNKTNEDYTKKTLFQVLSLNFEKFDEKTIISLIKGT